jgi:hypothetical protein
MALALFAGEDYEEVAGRLTGALRSWGSWDRRWEPPAKGAVTQARQRLGPEPVAELFSQVAEPVAGLEAEGAFLGPWSPNMARRPSNRAAILHGGGGSYACPRPGGFSGRPH